MQISRAGSLFVLANQERLRANALRLTLAFEQPLERPRVVEAQARQLAARPELALRLQPSETTRRLEWTALPADELAELQEAESRAVASPWAADSWEPYAPDGTRLPLRLRLVDEHTLVVFASQVWTHAPGALAWVEDWLGFYRSRSAKVPDRPPALEGQRLRRQPLGRQLSERSRALAWIASEFVANTGKLRRSDEPGLNGYGAGESLGRRGYASWRHVLDTEMTRRVLRGHQAAGQPLNVQLLVLLARFLFDVMPQRSQVRIGLVCDLSPWLPDGRPGDPGHPSYGVPLTLHCSGHLVAEARRALHAVRGSLPYRLACLTELPLRNELRRLEQVSRRSGPALAARTPFGDVQALLAHVGRNLGLRRIESMCPWASVTAAAPVPVLSACQVAGSLALEVSFPTDVYDAARLLPLLDELPARLLAGPS